MRHVKLFLASGNALKKDRDEIMLFLANKNQFLVKHGIFLELVRWEFLSSSFSETRKQDDFNKVLDESEIFTCLIFDRIGQYTKEEFDKAYQNYKQGKNPKKFYLYFKTLPKGKREEAIEVYELKKTIEKDEQIYREYKNPDQLKLFLNQNLDEDLPGILKKALLENIYDTESKPMTDTISQDLLNVLDEADRMLNKNLTEEAMEAYQGAIKNIKKEENPQIYAKTLINLGHCYNNLSHFSEVEKNLNKAEIKFDEAIQILKNLEHDRKYFEAYEEMEDLYFKKSFIRSRKENLRKAYDYLSEMISDDQFKQFPDIHSRIYWRMAICHRDLAYIEDNQDHLEKCNYYYQEAISKANPEKNKIEHYKILSSYGGTLIQQHCHFHEQEEKLKHLKRGIDLCEKALQNLSSEEDLFEYSTALGYLSLGYGYRGKILSSVADYEHAIDYCNKELVLLEDFPDSIHYNQLLCKECGILQLLFSLTHDRKYLTESNQNCEKGLSRVTSHSSPQYYARYHANKGINCLFEASEPTVVESKKAELLQQALQELNRSLAILTKENYLLDFKRFSFYVAKCYYLFGQIQKKEDNWGKALLVINELEYCYHDNPIKDSIYEAIIDLKNKLQL